MAYIAAPDFPIRSITWTLDTPSQSNVSAWTGKRTVVVNPWFSKWSAHVELATQQSEDGFRLYRSFLVRCQGSLNTFRLYATAGAQNSNTGVTLSANASATATSITITGASTPLKEGQYFTLSGQLCCCTADQSGSTLVFQPPLRQAAGSGTTVVTSRPYALVHMSTSKFQYAIGSWRRFDNGFDVEEAILEADGAVPESTGIAPTLSSPTASVTGATTATIGATTDQGNGTLYWVVTTSGTTPSAVQIIAGQDSGGSAAAKSGSQAVSATGAQSVSVTALTTSTTYYGHFVQKNAGLLNSNTVSTGSFVPVALPAGLSTWRSAVAAAKGGSAGCALWCAGDSTTASPAVTQAQSAPYQLYSALLGASLPVVYDGFAGFATGETDSRVTGTFSPGAYNKATSGILLQNTGESCNFTPASNVDTFDIYILKGSGTGHASVKINSGSTLETLSLNYIDVGSVTTMQKVTVTGSLGANTLNIIWVDGTIEVVLIDAYNSAAKKIRVLPGGKSGATSGDLDELTAAGWGVPTLLSKLQPKLMTLNIGINDWETGVSTSTYNTNVTAMIAAQTYGDTLLIGPNSTGSVASEATQLTYISQLSTIASGHSLTMQNIRSNGTNWATYSAANSAGLMFGDGLHPNAAGYAQISPYVATPLLVGV